MPASGDHDRTPGGSDADRKLVHRGPVFGVRQVDYPDAEGRSVRKEYIEHPGAITVIPEDGDGSILMVRVGRLAVSRFLLEFCAGKLEPGERPRDAAGRELEEEVGRTAARLSELGSFLTSPGCSDERIHAFHATELTEIPNRLEAGEEIEVVRFDPQEIDELIASGGIDDGKTITAWHLFRHARSSRSEEPR
ncbi:MAG: NUDIX hydrolase [Phycisphaera sp.]|nr:NUDIX hydrolase [Phycisphaera sp.]